MRSRSQPYNAAQDFAPGLLRVSEAPPAPLSRMVLRLILLLVTLLLGWSMIGRLDIVAVAEGKLVPVTYLKIVQPSDAGIVRDILVKEGDHVSAGQLLASMDSNISEADSKSALAELQHAKLNLRRIEAELAGTPLRRIPGEPADLFTHVEAEYQINRRALEDALAQERAAHTKAEQELAASIETQQKLEQTLPSYRAQEDAYATLGKTGFAGNLMVLEKQRDRIEKQQELKSQEYTAASLKTAIAQSDKKLAQIQSSYRQKLLTDKVETYASVQKLEQELAKQQHKRSLLELRAPQAGIVKDLATHTPGTVVSPGTVLMTLVPQNEALQAEVWVNNEDAGFVHIDQPVQLKLATYPFQKYGMISGRVVHVGADSSDPPKPVTQQAGQTDNSTTTQRSAYRALVALEKQHLELGGARLELTPGMQLTAEIRLSNQTVMEYVLSPVRKAFMEAGRER